MTFNQSKKIHSRMQAAGYNMKAQIATPTPRPWTLSADSRDIYGPGNLFIVNVQGSHKEAMADAAHIVRCVNAHEALVEALQAMRDHLVYYREVPAGNCCIDKADAALRLARAEREEIPS